MAEDLNRNPEDKPSDPLREPEQEEISMNPKARSEELRDSLAGLPKPPPEPREREIDASPNARLTQTPYELPRPLGPSQERDLDSLKVNAIPNPRLNETLDGANDSAPQGLAMAPTKASIERGDVMKPGDADPAKAMKPSYLDISNAERTKDHELLNRIGEKLGVMGVSAILLIGGTFDDGTGAEHQSATRTREDGPVAAQRAPNMEADTSGQGRVRIEFRQPPAEHVVGPPHEMEQEVPASDMVKRIARAIFDTALEIQEERLQREDDDESVEQSHDKDGPS